MSRLGVIWVCRGRQIIKPAQSAAIPTAGACSFALRSNCRSPEAVKVSKGAAAASRKPPSIASIVAHRCVKLTFDSSCSANCVTYHSSALSPRCKEYPISDMALPVSSNQVKGSPKSLSQKIQHDFWCLIYCLNLSSGMFSCLSGNYPTFRSHLAAMHLNYASDASPHKGSPSATHYGSHPVQVQAAVPVQGRCTAVSDRIDQRS